MAINQPGPGVRSSLVMREAANWLERLSSTEITDVEFNAWLEWLEASDAHMEAYWRMEELWQLLGPHLSRVISQSERTGV